MSGRDRALCVCYGLFTAAGFVLMSWLAVDFVVAHRAGGVTGVVGDFVSEALSNPATVFIYTDLTLAWIALAVFMIVEARRLGMRHVWAYIVGAPLLALAVSLPAFMYVRQRKIGTTRGIQR